MKRKISSSYIPLLVGALTASMTLVGCEEECVEGVCVPVDGYYYDSLVTGVAYTAVNEEGVGRMGVTGGDGDPGRFRYLNDERVTFSIGDTVLGEAPAGPRLTPFDLAGVTEAAVGGCQVDGPLPEDDFRIVHNLAVLLQTMDTDGDHTTGIDISPGVAALFEGVSIDFDQAWAAFQNDTDLLGVLEAANTQTLFPDARELRSREEALGALYEGIGLCPDGTGGTGGTGGGGTADCSDVIPGSGEFGAPCRNDGDCSDGLPCCTSTAVSEACGVEVELCACI
jgi:hypothetical protein